jgi:hypothetical protein
VTLDLRIDSIDIQSLIAQAVTDYTSLSRAAHTSGDYGAVTRIDLCYSLGDSESTPWVHLHFDTKPGSEPDGDPTHPDFGRLERAAWLPAIQVVFTDEEVLVIKLDGSSCLCDGSNFTKSIGEFLVQMLLDARSNGVFADLPRDSLCELGVEDPTTGEFGWPVYEDRGKENLVV